MNVLLYNNKMESSIGSELLKSLELPSQLQEILPSGYSYKLKKWTPFENNASHFEAVIFTNVYTEEEAQVWWHEFNIKSNTTMRVKATCPKTGKVNTFKIYLRCLHQGRAEKAEKLEQQQNRKSPKPPVKRNTNCPAGMIVAIRRHIKYSRSKLRDPIDPVHPCEVRIRFIHNHPTNEAELLRFRPVSKEAEEKLLNLYQLGHSPTSALETLKIDLQMVYGSLYSQVVSDRFHCPDKAFCYRLYYKHFGKDYSNIEKKDFIAVLDAKVQHYNNFLGESCLVVGFCGTDCVIAVCTPPMKRAHSLPQCCDVVFVETYESHCSKDQGKHYVLLLIALTALGGMPLGAILTTSNATSFQKLGFQLLQQVLPTNAFSGKGMAGPCAFLIENSDDQRTALLEVWPDSNVITCTFRLLQDLWRWLWDERHNILKDHRLYLLYLAKTLLYAANNMEMNEKYQALCADNIAIHYPIYLQFIETLWERRSTWKFSSLQQLSLLPGANNYYEAAGRALKDKLFEQARTFNFVQLLNFLVTRLDSYHKIKLHDILNSKSSHVFRTHFPSNIPFHVDNEINQVAGNYYLVPSEQGDGNIYTVDAELNVCSCPFGLNGTLCIHQYWVFLKVPTEMFKVQFCDTELKQKLLFVTTEMDSPPVSHSQIILDIPSLPQVVLNTSEFQLGVNAEVIADCSVVHSNSLQSEVLAEPLLVPSNPIETVINVSQIPSVHIAPLSNSHEVISIPISADSCHQESSVVFVNALSKPVEEMNGATLTDPCIEEDVGNANMNNASLINVHKNSDEEKSNHDDTEKTERRMVEILEKFEMFYERVRDGLRNQPNHFLPALEIMMKNLERKGNSDDFLVSGLSFFGVISAPSLMNKVRKRKNEENVTFVGVNNKEMLPKVYGRPMITYSKKRQLVISKEDELKEDINGPISTNHSSTLIS